MIQVISNMKTDRTEREPVSVDVNTCFRFCS